MKKAAQQSAPVNLGTKRACPKCSTKFYDFGKPEIVCPKCQAALDAAALNPVARLAEAKKAKAPAEKSSDVPAAAEELAVDENEDVIESVDDLGDEDDDVVEEIDVDDEEEQEF